jgi:hypothetical protein
MFMPIAVLALTAGAFGIGTTEFIIMGLLLQVAATMQVTDPRRRPADLGLCARGLRRGADADPCQPAMPRKRCCWR